ncbi:MAG: haloacid dehalogenase-like hydrolase [Bacilli bacterium]|nr:haloacid dehalogenase-like hydrolase [Bacilli bacterium]
MSNKPIVAIMYDYDHTLCKEDMQNYGLAPALGLTPSAYWAKVAKNTKETQCEMILSFLYSTVRQALTKGIKPTREWFNSLGKNIKHYPGVLTWFQKMNEYAKSKGIILEHYVVSSGNKEIIEGGPIAKEFKKIFACEYHYDKDSKLAVWPKFVINYTQKTQYLYRIEKGVLNVNDDIKINQKSKPRIPHSNMIYIGDGITDVPCMTVVKNSGGHSIAVYDKKKKDIALKLMQEERISYACLADYRKDQELDKVVKLIIDNIAVHEKLAHRRAKEKKKL